MNLFILMTKFNSRMPSISLNFLKNDFSIENIFSDIWFHYNEELVAET